MIRVSERSFKFFPHSVGPYLTHSLRSRVDRIARLRRYGNEKQLPHILHSSSRTHTHTLLLLLLLLRRNT